MSDVDTVDPAPDTRDTTDTGDGEEFNPPPTGTDILTDEQLALGGYVTEEGVVAGIFFWNDPTYPANGDAGAFVRAHDRSIVQAENEQRDRQAELGAGPTDTDLT